MAAKRVYFFGGGKAEGNGSMKDVLGGKGAGLAEMTNLGVPVPPGFTISTEVCTLYYKNRGKIPADVTREIAAQLVRLERATGKKFGDPKNPLLVSVRSGARFSMPGMMDTILNLKAEDLKEACGRFKGIVKGRTRKEFPQDPQVQLALARDAVFQSWNNERARYYRKTNNIPDDIGTAVNVQAMVFGNMGNDCATGVGFTRNPATGAKEFYGEYLVNAQGEDVVAGIRTPRQVTIAGKKANNSTLPAMEEVMPTVFKQLDEVRGQLEKHYCDMQDIEFTVQQGKLYMLQTRNGKRTAAAALKIAVDLCSEGVI